MVKAKNDFKHDRGPKSPQEYKQEAKALQVQIDLCYDAFSFFIRYPIRLIQEINVDWQTSQAIFDTLVYAGDHPGLRREKIIYPKTLPKDMLYLEIQKDKWIPLYPHMSVQYCPSCKIRETYFVDRQDGSNDRVVLKSFERGHVHESDEDAKEVSKHLEYWIGNNLKG